MALEDYNLGDLIRLVRDEYGVDDSQDSIQRIKDKINEGMNSIARAQPHFPWLETTHNVDIDAQISSTGDFTQGARTFTDSTLATTDIKRQPLIVGATQSPPSIGYLIEDVALPTITLSSHYLGSTDTGVSYTIPTGTISLPDNFNKIKQNFDATTIDGQKIRWKNARTFEAAKRTNSFIAEANRIYTIIPDPIGEETEYYMQVFPYFTSLTSIEFRYYRAPDKLINNSDTPPMPANDRSVVLYYALWYFGRSIGADNAEAHGQTAREELNNLIDKIDVSDDLDNEYDGNVIYERSALFDKSFDVDVDFSPGFD